MHITNFHDISRRFPVIVAISQIGTFDRKCLFLTHSFGVNPLNSRFKKTINTNLESLNSLGVIHQYNQLTDERTTDG